MKRASTFVIVFFLLFGVLPLAAGLVFTLLYSLGLAGSLGEGFTLQYWHAALRDGELWQSLALSAAVSIAAVLLSTLAAFAVLFACRHKKKKKRVHYLLHWPLAMPPVVAAFVSFQWLGNSGVLSRVAHALGWSADTGDFPALINDPYYLGVLLTLLLLSFPFFLLLLLNHYRSAQMGELAQLAATLGAGAGQIRRHVAIPVLLQRMRPTLLLYFVFLFGAFEVALLLGRQSPAMISVFIHRKFNKFNLLDLPVANVATVVYALFIVALIAAFLQLARDKNTAGT